MSQWSKQAVQAIEADYQRSADTHMIRLELPCLAHAQLYLKDESTHPTGSLKHRLARSLFLYALCNGLIEQGSTIVEASSGSTAVSEAYFARLLGLPFVAVVPAGTSREKIEQIEFYGARCHRVAARDLYGEAARLARELGGHYMDQFTYAERATDWRGNNNVAESIYAQLTSERWPVPSWIVVSAGTGGTSATIGRYIRYRRFDTRLCVADPEHSVFYDYYHSRDASLSASRASNIEGIGRPRVEPSFVPGVIDRMIKVPDAAAFATLRLLERLLRRKCGGSTGTNVYAALQIAAELEQRRERGSIVSMICDSGERYLDTYFNETWLAQNGFDVAPFAAQLDAFLQTGQMQSA